MNKNSDGLTAYDILRMPECPIKLPVARSMTQAKIDYEHKEPVIFQWYEDYKSSAGSVVITVPIPSKERVFTLEYILCAAIHFEDGNTYEHQPKNIEAGIVVCGRRHHNCFTVLDRKFRGGLRGCMTQGFVTSTDRFVDRREGGEIAFAAGQTKKLEKKLFSEDLY